MRDENKRNLTIIDLDTMTFYIASKQFVKLENKTDKQAVIDNVNEFIDNIVLTTNTHDFCMFYQVKGHSNYRKFLYSDYKANRDKQETPEFMTVWRDTIHQAYKDRGAVPLYNIESDDALVITYYANKDNYNITMASVDKDMKQVSCMHYNFGAKKEEIDPFDYVDSQKALKNWAIQMFTGDSTDSIIGCGKKEKSIIKTGKNAGNERIARKGIGEGAAIKLLEGIDTVQEVNKLHYAQYKEMFGDDWYSHYLKAKKLLTLLPILPIEFIFDADRPFKANIMPNDINTPSTLFNNI